MLSWLPSYVYSPKLGAVVVGVLLFAITGCGRKVSYEPTWMDSPTTHDLSVRDATYTPVSKRPVVNLNAPVLIAVHGYSASTFEWKELFDTLDRTQGGPIDVSLVKMGGHGESYDAFKHSTWTDWQKPILDEYHALVKLGYTNISIIAASSGGTVTLEALSRDQFSDALRHLFFIDTLVIPRDKKLYWMPFLSVFIKNLPISFSVTLTRENWYNNRPGSTLASLSKLIKRVESQLKTGITIRPSQSVSVFQSQDDPTVDPVSATLIYQGFDPTQSNVRLNKIKSQLHVFSHLTTKENVSDSDRRNQKMLFDYIVERLR